MRLGMKMALERKKRAAAQPVLVTVSGACTGMEPASNRVGCILRVSNDGGSGRYYVPLSPHDCRGKFPEGRAVKFRIYSDAQPDGDGVYDTAGDMEHLWDITGRNWPRK